MFIYIMYTYCRLSDNYNAPDKIKQTPITIVLAKWEQLRFFASIKGDNLQMEVKKDAVAVVAKILEEIPEDSERIKVIQQNYHGMTAIEYDIKSGNGIIVQVKSVIATYVYMSKFTNFNFFRLF